ncbi:MAG: GNAT family N-acetyltransferase [Minisyncoccales bacterium]
MKKLNQKIEIRPPKISDLNSLLAMINSLVEEKAMITIQKKQTLKQEKEYLEGIIKDKEGVHLFLIINGEVMGNARVGRLKSIENHIGQLGISVKKEARGLGLGEKLFREVMNKAIKKFKLKIITLDVHMKNKIAQNLYKKMGFEKVGIIKGGARHYGKYEDSMIMAKYI